jgi:hypothetical protein
MAILTCDRTERLRCSEGAGGAGQLSRGGDLRQKGRLSGENGRVADRSPCAFRAGLAGRMALV